MFAVNTKKTLLHSPPRSVSRLITKDGHSNTHLTKIPKKHLSYLLDLGTTLVQTRWRWILLALIVVHFASFALFAILWALVAHASGDFDGSSAPCVANTRSFTGYFLLSAETITTIGYGYRYPTEECRHGWILIVLQSFFSIALQGGFIGVVYVKLAKPNRSSGRLFSRKAVICLRDGKLCFIIRLTDTVGKVSCGTHLTMYFVDANSEMSIKQMTVEPYGLLLPLPLDIVHVIDANSPLWNWRADKVLGKKFEVIVMVEGSSLVTGQLSQHKTSYTESDVLWGHWWLQCVRKKQSTYEVDYDVLNKTCQHFDAAFYSAKELAAIKSVVIRQ